ncbi:SRPBCC family protein [Massilia niastensis]|uniref:SRPBCC family protein n=1 Tax=Massilia niastensis TaxID=544911 RepID=UPI0003643074|nr:SRPBCC domain-containing protein [Massilia niastensis]
MKIVRQSDHEISDAGVQQATGDTLAGWFQRIDGKGGVALGRRGIGDWMYGELKVDPWWVGTITNEYEVARGQLEKDGKPKGYTICATKSIKSDASACYAAFTEPAQLDRWFGPGNQIEVAPGGRWTNADGNAATIKKASPGKNVRMTWEDPELDIPTPVEVKFQPTAEKCTVIVTIDRLQTRAEADGYRKAWGEALGRLKGLLEG